MKHSAVRLISPSKQEIITQKGYFTEGYIDFAEDNTLDISVCREMSLGRQVHVFLFELCNAQRQAAFKKIWNELDAGKIASSEVYALNLEYLEFLNCSQHDKIIKESIQNKFWTSGMEKYLYSYGSSDWHLYLKNQIANGHYQAYINDYEMHSKSKKEQKEFKKRSPAS
jgi:hypothetical protein